MTDKVRIYSDATGLWWRPDGKGYTYIRAEAGLYTRARAATLITDDKQRRERLIDEGDPFDPRAESRKETELLALRARVAELEGEVATLRAQLAAPLRLGRGPTVEEAKAHADAQEDGHGWWLVSFDVRRHPDDEAIYFEIASIEVEDGEVFVDGMSSADGSRYTEITDAIPLDASRQPCGVGVKV